MADSATAHEISAQFLTARSWLKNHRPDMGRPGRPKIFWRGDIELQETPLTGTDGRSAGYLLVATDPRMPPVLEYAEHGASLTDGLSRMISDVYPKARIERFVFYSSTEIAAEVSQDGQLYLLHLPSLISRKISQPHRAGVSPEEVFDQSSMREMSERTQGPPLPVPPEKMELTNAVPVKYNQNCSSYGRLASAPTLGSGLSVCSPSAISGCAPVAWAMLLSSLKRKKAKGAEAVWKTDSDWQKDWPTRASGDPSRSAGVKSTIWAAHKLMSTSADGNTKNDKLFAGEGVAKDFGLNWTFKLDAAPLFLTAVRMIALYKAPLLWAAEGNWPAGAEPHGGHCVIAYGYEQRSGMVKICMGWGKPDDTDASKSYIDDHYITWNQYKNSRIVYLLEY